METHHHVELSHKIYLVNKLPKLQGSFSLEKTPKSKKNMLSYINEVTSMSEEKVRVKLDKHRWPDEVEIERKKKRNLVIIVVAVLLAFFSGTFFGIWTNVGRSVIQNNSQTQDRFDTIYNTMLNNWYFGKDIENLSEELMTKALMGMTGFESDPNTSYMSSSEMENFTNSIEMGYVGIGVQYRTMDGQNIVERVFRDSPAEKAGVLPGDIFFEVDHQSLEGLSSEEISNMVKGEAGTEVVISFLRQGEIITLTIIRGEVHNSAFGYMLEDEVGYLEISQFGTTTSTEVEAYLQDLISKGATKLIIDLRGNGGGYLVSVVNICSFFLEADSVILIQEDRNGRYSYSKANKGNKYDFEEIVILVNENTASAAEVMTAALHDNIGVKVVGVTTYGKGTVQVPLTFSDGSALKYTTSEWLTPLEEKIHNMGITPDYIVELHPILNAYIPQMEEGEEFRYDNVHEKISMVQMALDFLGYNVDRQDGYFSRATETSLRAYQSNNGKTVNGIITEEIYNMVITDAIRTWSLNQREYDNQLIEALELLNGN